MRVATSWLVYLSEVVHELRRSFPPRAKQGVTIFFTGLSGSGKSTIANVLLTKFLESADGRSQFSTAIWCAAPFFGAGISKEHRDINIRASATLLRKSRKTGYCHLRSIAPYDATRKHVRQMIEPYGGFVLVHVATSVEVCEQRDRKGLLPRRAREFFKGSLAFLILTRCRRRRGGDQHWRALTGGSGAANHSVP